MKLHDSRTRSRNRFRFPAAVLIGGLVWTAGPGAGAGHAQASRPASGPTSAPTTQPASQPTSQPASARPLRVPPVPGFLARVAPSGKRVLIHYKTNFDHDDNPGCVAFNAALAAVAAGHKVELLYDAGGVFDLKLWHGQPASYHYEIPQKLKELLATQYPIRPADMPDTYQGYLHWLHAMGVEITYNGFMAALVDLQPTIAKGGPHVESIATPVSLEDIVAHRDAADIYLVY